MVIIISGKQKICSAQGTGQKSIIFKITTSIHHDTLLCKLPLGALVMSALRLELPKCIYYGLVSFSKLFTSILLWQARASQWNWIQLFILGDSVWFCSCSASKSSIWLLINQTCKTEMFISMTNIILQYTKENQNEICMLVLSIHNYDAMKTH